MNFYVSRSGVHFSPSKRILTKIIFVLLAILAIFFFSIFDVKAANLDNFSQLESFPVTFTPNDNRMGFQTAILGENYQTYSQDYSFVNGYITVNKNYDYLILPVETYWNVASSNGQQNDVKMSVLIGLRTNKGVNYCDYSQDNNMATCPFGITGATQVQKVLIQYTFTRFGYSTGEIGYGAMIGTSWYGGNINNNSQIINNTQNIDNSVNNMNDTINDSNISDDQKSESGSFFTNFSDKDNGGLSAIITAPIRAINSMLSDTCTPLTATYKGKVIRFECGSYWWAKMPQIKAWLNVIYDGLLCFYILKAFYNEIQKLKDPDDESRVEVIDL